ncbi:GNAT family N-acetyltransferase [Marinactinospora thermotolerans]|uniref:GNAT family N-acetyltransferase n=1 Tax=Marinactinospora thermotolerans TaxID=531310 RepID=UPI003D946D73
MPTTPHLIDLHANRAWPATTTRHHHGWLLRHTPGVTRNRSNSALPPHPQHHPHHHIDAIETFYTQRGLTPRIQVTPAHQHTELDTHLTQRGYTTASPTLVLTAPTTIATTAPTPPITLTPTPTHHWLTTHHQLTGHDDTPILTRIHTPTAFAHLNIDGHTAGIALFTAAPGWAGVFCMATHPHHRRTGVATALLHAGAAWATRNGAHRLYLQVERDNHAARRLYATTGFTETHRYHYRIAPRP